MRKLDFIGQRFGRLVVITEVERYRSPSGKTSRRRFLCQCDCGQTTAVMINSLTRPNTISCGCYNSEAASLRAYRHGHKKYKSGTYTSWTDMIQRCTNPKRKYYSDYGGRGIRVCDRWFDFRNFLADMGERPKGMSLDRHPDNNGNYEPGNCRWADNYQQANNQRRNVRIWYAGEYLTLAQFCRALNLPYDKFYDRYIRKKVPLEQILLECKVV